MYTNNNADDAGNVPRNVSSWQEFVGLCVGLFLRTSLMYDVYDCIKSTEIVE